MTYSKTDADKEEGVTQPEGAVSFDKETDKAVESFILELEAHMSIFDRGFQSGLELGQKKGSVDGFKYGLIVMGVSAIALFIVTRMF